jgi:(R)-2-hydroxyacyl-CoA dehydratese activating ATPase
MTSLPMKHDKTGVVAGIDLGSTTIKVVIYDGSGYIARIVSASYNPSMTALALLASASVEYGLPSPPATIVTTGYGRRTMKDAALTPTEIACHAKGASFLLPGCRFVIDIGGQDAKGIRLSPEGNVEDFVMNDKCAAGTGRFLSATGQALGVPVDQLAGYARGAEPYRINAMCTVFAESEVISLVNQGVERGAIIAGLHASIARRTASMVASLHPIPPIAFTGGVSQNGDIAQKLGEELRRPVIVPRDASYAGALGAALMAWDHLNSSEPQER